MFTRSMLICTLAGMLWAAPPLASVVPGGLESVQAQQGHFAYLSLVTLSTLGYGDITPITALGQTAAWAQAVVGELYMAILVGLLLGNGVHILSLIGHTFTHWRRDRKDKKIQEVVENLVDSVLIVLAVLF